MCRNRHATVPLSFFLTGFLACIADLLSFLFSHGFYHTLQLQSQLCRIHADEALAFTAEDLMSQAIEFVLC
jgi:hypothetical protein